MNTQEKENIISCLTTQVYKALETAEKYALKPCDFKDYMQSIMFMTEAMKNISKT